MERSASGSGNSPLFLDNSGAQVRAEEQARRRLIRALEHEIDAVPCPACGWFQQNMIPILRAARNRWMFYTALGLIFVLVFALLSTWVIYLGSRQTPEWLVILLGVDAGIAGLAVGLFVYRRVRSASWDPNTSDPQERKLLGQSRAILREQMENLLGQMQGDPEQPPEQLPS
jgi:hypothetical protein